jgi:1-(5-phosphoribosyl)-5-[(5-phosphoribosylamino)methylideneamino] imidazole-4-carboxamide isomerase/N-(5'phosphoribosyl)anthranilate isomerase
MSEQRPEGPDDLQVPAELTAEELAEAELPPNAVPVLEILPAVDVADGTAVRLVQGAAGSETSYGDPVQAALAWQAQGAEWIHLVDLDAAFGRGSNAELLARIVGELDIQVELSGGIRDDESLAAALATGCTRVNIGTAALEDPEWVARAIVEHGERIAVGLDVRGTTLSARGWTQDGGDLFEVLARLDGQGCARYVVTDVAKDGTLKGPNLELLRRVCEATDRPIVASGGVGSLADVHAINELGVEGVEGLIIGKALYSGAFTLPEVLAAVAPRVETWNSPFRRGDEIPGVMP